MPTYSGAAGIAPTGVIATGILGDAPAPTAPLQVGGRTGKLRYRVLDPVTGVVLIDDLPHLHQSTWDMVGFQPGATGRSAIGSFSVKLFPPGSPGYKNAKQFYDLLAEGQRIEGYLGDIIAGDPRFTGLIRSMVRSFTEFTIGGDDSLALLQLSRTGLKEVFSGTTDALVQYALKGFDLAFGDDFSLGFGNFTNDGTWVATTDLGKAAIKPGSTGDGLLYTNSSFSNAQYADCSIEALFRLVCDSSPNAKAEASIIAAVADSNNLVLGQIIFWYVSAGRFAIDVSIRQKSGGTYTLRAQVAQAFSVPTNVLPVNLELKGYQASVNKYLWRLLINGSDVGCFWIQDVAAAAPTGGVGLRSSQGAATFTAEQCYVRTAPEGLKLWSKVNWFQPGRISLGTQSVNQAIPDTPTIDLLQLAATTETGEYRKNSKAGLNQDTVDFGQTVGTDYAAQIRFEYPGNIVDASIEPNAEPFGSIIQSSASPSLTGEGWIRFTDIIKVKSVGARMIAAAAGRISDIIAHRLYAQQLSSLSGNPGKAKRVTVRRNEWTDWVRELDVVQLHMPVFNINYARAKVVGYIFKEDAGTIEYMLDQYPRTLDRLPALDRMLASLETLTSGGDTATDPSKPFALVRQPSTTLPVNPWKMRVFQAGAQNVSKDVVTKILFDTVTTDTSNAFSAANSNYTAPVAGYYVIDAAVSFAQPSEANQWQYWIAFIYVNSALAKQGTTTEFLEPGIAVSVAQCSATVVDNCYYLNAGDVVDIRFVVHVAAATVAIATGTTYTAWSMHLVSG